MTRRISASRVSSEPAKTNTQAMKPSTASVTMARRQPRGIGSTRAEQAGAAVEHRGQDDSAKMSSSGWASTITPATASASASHTLARFNSARITGSRSSIGPALLGSRGAGRRVTGRESPARPGPAAAPGRDGARCRRGRRQRGQPADRVPVRRAAVEAEGDEFGAAADILPRAPARPAPVRQCRSGCRRCCRDCRPSGRHGLRDCDPREIVAGRLALRRSCRRCAPRDRHGSGWVLAIDRQLAIAMAVGLGDPRKSRRGRHGRARCRRARWGRPGSRVRGRSSRGKARPFR